MCLSTHTYLFIFPLPEQCQGGRCPAHRKNNLQWKKKSVCVCVGGVLVEGKIYEYANLVTVWNLVMSGKCCCHLSLCRGHCLMPGSWAQILLSELPAATSPVISHELEPNYSLATRSWACYMFTMPGHLCCSKKTLYCSVLQILFKIWPEGLRGQTTFWRMLRAYLISQKQKYLVSTPRRGVVRSRYWLNTLHEQLRRTDPKSGFYKVIIVIMSTWM